MIDAAITVNEPSAEIRAKARGTNFWFHLSILYRIAICNRGPSVRETSDCGHPVRFNRNFKISNCSQTVIALICLLPGERYIRLVSPSLPALRCTEIMPASISCVNSCEPHAHSPSEFIYSCLSLNFKTLIAIIVILMTISPSPIPIKQNQSHQVRHR